MGPHGPMGPMGPPSPRLRLGIPRRGGIVHQILNFFTIFGDFGTFSQGRDPSRKIRSVLKPLELRSKVQKLNSGPIPGQFWPKMGGSGFLSQHVHLWPAGRGPRAPAGPARALGPGGCREAADKFSSFLLPSSFFLDLAIGYGLLAFQLAMGYWLSSWL